MVVDGEVVASKNKSMLTRILGGGWPDHGDVIERVKERVQRVK